MTPFPPTDGTAHAHGRGCWIDLTTDDIDELPEVVTQANMRALRVTIGARASTGEPDGRRPTPDSGDRAEATRFRDSAQGVPHGRD